MKLSFAMTCLLLTAACAAPGPDMQALDAARSRYALADSSPDQDVTGTGTGDEQLARNDPASPSGPIEEMEAPSVGHIPAELIPGRPEPEEAIVCERVVPTGSILRVRVCRHRSEIDAREMADQRMIDTIKNNTANGASRL